MKYLICLLAITSIITHDMMPGGYKKIEVNINDAYINKVLLLIHDQIKADTNGTGEVYPVACNLLLI